MKDLLSLFTSLSQMNIKNKIPYLAVLTALSITLFVIESIIPRPLPFLKFGLANIVILILIYFKDYQSTVIIAFSKTLFGGFLTGTIFSPATILSLSGTFLSLIVMIIFSKSKINFSIIGISIIGAITHNFGQLIAVRFIIIRSNNIFYLTPIMLFIGLVTGILIGYFVAEFITRIKQKENYVS